MKKYILACLIVAESLFAGPVGYVDDSKGIQADTSAAVLAIKSEEGKPKKVIFGICKNSAEITRDCIEAGLSTAKPLTQFDNEYVALLGLRTYKEKVAQLANLEKNIAIWTTQLETNSQNQDSAKALSPDKIRTLQASINAGLNQTVILQKDIQAIKTDPKNALNAAYVDYAIVMDGLNSDDESDSKVDASLFRSTNKLGGEAIHTMYKDWKLKNLCYCGTHYALKNYCAIGKNGALLAFTKTTTASDCQRREFCQTASWSKKGQSTTEAEATDLPTVLKNSCAGYFEMGDMQDPRLIRPTIIPTQPEVNKVLTAQEIQTTLDTKFNDGVSCSFKPLLTRDRRVLYNPDAIVGIGTTPRLALQAACTACYEDLMKERTRLKNNPNMRERITFFGLEKCVYEASSCVADGNVPITVDSRTFDVAFQDGKATGSNYCFIQK